MMGSSLNIRVMVGVVAAASLIATAATAASAVSTTTVAGDIRAHTRTTGVVAPPRPVAEPVEMIAGYPNVADGARRVRLALAGDGYALVVWHEFHGIDPVSQKGQWQLVSATRSVEGTWSAPQPVSDLFFADYIALDVATTGPDASVAVWNEDPGQDPPSVYASLLRGSTWTSPERVGAGWNPRVAMNAAGVVMSWTSGDSTGAHSTRVRTLPAGSTGAWEPARTFTGGQASVSAAGDKGASAVVWGNFIKGRLRVLYRGNEADSWEAPVSIPSRDYNDDAPPAVTVDRAGRVTVVWMRGRHVYWTRRGMAGTWSKVAEVPGRVGWMGEYGGTSATVNGRGRVLARWVTDGTGTFTARYRPRSGWTRAALLSPDQPLLFGAAPGDPLLTGDGVAMVLGGSEDRLAWLSQPAGQPWSPVRTVASASPPSVVDSFGRVAAAVVWDEGGLHFHRFRVPSTP